MIGSRVVLLVVVAVLPALVAPRQGSRGVSRVQAQGRADPREASCDYTCKDRGGCRVRWMGPGRAGPSQGYCTRGGRCRGTPAECRPCTDRCRHFKSPNSQPLLTIEAVIAEEEDYDSEQNGPPSPPPTPVGPPAPPPPVPAPTPPPTRPPTTRPPTTRPTAPTPAPTRPPTRPTPPPTPQPTRPPTRPTNPTTRPTNPPTRPTNPPTRPTNPPRPRPTSRPVGPPRPSRRGNPLEFALRLIRNKLELKQRLLSNAISWKKSMLKKVFQG